MRPGQPATVTVDWTLNAPVPWSAEPARRAGTVHLADSVDDLSRVAASLAVAQTLTSMLFGISARDPWRLGAAAIALASAAAIGSLLPARRASRLDPMTALRAE